MDKLLDEAKELRYMSKILRSKSLIKDGGTKTDFEVAVGIKKRDNEGRISKEDRKKSDTNFRKWLDSLCKEGIISTDGYRIVKGNQIPVLYIDKREFKKRIKRQENFNTAISLMYDFFYMHDPNEHLKD